MQISELMMQGVQLLALGMGSVFVFLTILVLTMKTTSWLAISIGGEEEAAAPTRREVKGGVDQNIIPVIAAAVAVWRKRNN